MNSRHYELHCTAPKAINFEMKEVFMCGVACFVIPGCYSVLYLKNYTIIGASCYAFSRFPLSKSPEKYTLLLSCKK